MQGTRSRVDSLASVAEAEVVETVTSLLRCFCPSMAWLFLLLLKQVRWLRSLRAVLTTLGALVCLYFKWHCFAESLSRRSRYSWTARSVDARNVGTRLEDPGLTPELGHGMRGMINLWAVLFHVLDERSIEAINIIFILCLWIGQSFANLLFGGLDSLLPSLYHWANTLANPDGLPLSSGQCFGQYWWHIEG